MASKILIGIALDGDSEVKRKLQEVGEAGKRSLENINSKIGGAQSTFGKLSKEAGGLKEALAPIAEAGGLAGLLGGAGLGGLLARIATGPAGIIGGITSALLGMAKIGDETQRVKGRLSALGDDKGFERLTTRAKAAGTSVENLVTRQEQFDELRQKLNAQNTSIIRPPGFQPGANEEAAAGVRVFGGGRQITPPSQEAFGKFDSQLLAQVRRDVKSSEEAKTITDQFQKTLGQTGLTADLLRSLPPNARKFLTSQLEKPLGRGFENPEVLATDIERGRVRPQDLTATSVIQAGAAPNEAFTKAAESARGVGEAFDALTASAGRLLEKLGGDHAGVTPGIDKATDLVNQGGELLDQMAKNRTEIGPQSLGEVFSSDKGDLLGRFTGYIRNQLSASAPKPGEANPFGQITSGATDIFKQLFSGDYFNKNAQLPERPAYNVPSSESKTGQLDSAAEKLSKAADDLSQAATITDGRRYSRQLNPEGHASGGAVFGAGTATSDSIPAMLSNGEYVVKAASASKIGLAYLDRLNSYADGGSIVSGLGSLTAGTYDIQPTDDGGAIINGVKYAPGSPILNDPNVKAALARARASKSQDEGKRHKSDFTGIFGGHVFDTPGSYARGGAVGRGLRRFASGGYVNILPHFADGGWADIGGAAPSMIGSAGGDGPLHRVDLTTNQGRFPVMASGDVARAMASAARDSADAQTGPRPSWFKGR